MPLDEGNNENGDGCSANRGCAAMIATALEKLSFHVYQMVGIRFTQADLNRSVLAVAKQLTPGNKTGYTQNYFHEEALFSAALALDAENRYGLVTWLIRQYELEKLDGKPCGASSTAVLGQVWRDYYEVALARMDLCGITPRPGVTDIGIQAVMKLRMADYIPSLAAAKDIGLEGLNLGGLDAPFHQQDNPLKAFLSAAYKHFVAAIDDDDPLIAMGLEQALIIQWRAITIDTSHTIQGRL